MVLCKLKLLSIAKYAKIGSYARNEYYVSIPVCLQFTGCHASIISPLEEHRIPTISRMRHGHASVLTLEHRGNHSQLCMLLALVQIVHYLNQVETVGKFQVKWTGLPTNNSNRVKDNVKDCAIAKCSCTKRHLSAMETNARLKVYMENGWNHSRWLFMASAWSANRFKPFGRYACIHQPFPPKQIKIKFKRSSWYFKTHSNTKQCNRKGDVQRHQ